MTSDSSGSGGARPSAGFSKGHSSPTRGVQSGIDARIGAGVFTTPHGLCACVDMHDIAVGSAEAELTAAERQYAAAFRGARRRAFVAGRIAMHQLVGGATSIATDDRGAPVLRPGLTGSISHKGTRAVAIVAPADLGCVGIDIERAAPPRGDIGGRILTAREPAVTGKLLTRIFAIKEAIYKAIDPIVRRYVGFQEVEVIGKNAQVVDRAALPVALEYWCAERDGYWLATARAVAHAVLPV